jgi:hypothetical protein
MAFHRLQRLAAEPQERDAAAREEQRAPQQSPPRPAGHRLAALAGTVPAPMQKPAMQPKGMPIGHEPQARSYGGLDTLQLLTAGAAAALKETDYRDPRYHGGTDKTGIHLFTIQHDTKRAADLQVHWHPATTLHPNETWTVRLSGEGAGANTDALQWMKDLVRGTPSGTKIALGAGSKAVAAGGAAAASTEYNEQFPAL